MIRILPADDTAFIRYALALMREARLDARIFGESFSMEGLLANIVVGIQERSFSTGSFAVHRKTGGWKCCAL